MKLWPSTAGNFFASGRAERDRSTACSSERLLPPSRQSKLFQRVAGDSEHYRQHPQERRQLLKASAEPEHFPLQLSRVHADRVDSHDWSVWISEPATGGRARDTSLNRAADVLRGADQIPKSVIVTTLRASCSGQSPVGIS